MRRFFQLHTVALQQYFHHYVVECCQVTNIYSGPGEAVQGTQSGESLPGCAKAKGGWLPAVWYVGHQHFEGHIVLRDVIRIIADVKMNWGAGIASCVFVAVQEF